ncbi:replication fork protection component Swi3-domain-containing protein [Coniella lustricola]|uniref:Chromosome segregation in meiosis protein n=1 Tax=Coniella lustricola TaxID=2025994 RepID=A0A2T3AEC3_9PEZI|nr:replication fork protection component Swi3-domain-containing protein [Coniella lustricola]
MAEATKDRVPSFDEFDNLFSDPDLDDDPFASPGKDKAESKKRKEPGDNLGLDEEVSVAKKPRVPRIKLDADRLVSQKGIPGLRKRAKDLKLKGKGHEWRDAARILSFYQEWLDDLFPKAKFLDALAMVEKIGHTRPLHELRTNLINENKPKSSAVYEDGGMDAAGTTQEEAGTQQEQPGSLAPKPMESLSSRPRTPGRNDWFEDDIYNATPAAKRKKTDAEPQDEPDDDELDALMAQTCGPPSQNRASDRPIEGGFSDRRIYKKPAPPDDEDDLDALMAEAEIGQRDRQEPPASRKAGHDDIDDLDALMAEAESQQSAPPESAVAEASGSKRPDFGDDEEAMAEMDGLW